MNYSYLYLLFMYYFNVKRDYYECHDVMEELWLEERRDRFYQGLLQVAVGLYHFRWNNIKGSILLFEGAVEKLEPYPDVMGGIDLKKIRDEAGEYLFKLRNYEHKPFDFYDLTIEIIDEELQEMVESIQSEM
jgi:predicted metal-dependent hydrolase